MTLQQLQDWLDKIKKENNLTGTELVYTDFENGFCSIFVPIPGKKTKYSEIERITWPVQEF